ncbi:MAG: SAM-dependent methyltransferase [Verrucomicrobiae bacterium]|nr:SAM-dependent methyltransferase [Verrucomicrobiae bacterium]
MSVALEEKLKNDILAHGALTFRNFMERCLYDEDQGFYRKIRQPLGKEGHFFTNVQVSHLYGQLLAQQLREVWVTMGKPGGFTIMEQGAHDGQLAVDILRWCRDFSSDFFEALTYGIIEPWEKGQQWQREKLCEAKLEKKVCHSESLKKIDEGSICGIFFSHELVDAFPVHRIVRGQEEWREIYVGWEKDRGFFEFASVLSSEVLTKEIEQLPLPRIEGYRTEINLEVKDWIKEVARIIKKGFVLTIDYGYSQEEYYAEHRSEGALSAYYRHQRQKSFCERVGDQDLTAHVNFSLLKREGEKVGLDFYGFTDQHHFLIGLAKEELLKMEGKLADSSSKSWIRAFQTLMHPGLMGANFKLLCQTKNVLEPFSVLSGFQDGNNRL